MLADRSMIIHLSRLAFYSLFFLVFYGCIFSPTRDSRISAFEMNLQVEQAAEKTFPESLKYSSLQAYFDHRYGIFIQADYSAYVNPMDKGPDYYQDLSRGVILAHRLSRSAYLRPEHKIVVAIHSPILEVVRSWSVEYLRRFEDPAKIPEYDDKATINDRLYIYNGVEKREGSYPDWSEIHDVQGKLLKELEERKYSASGFLLPQVGIVFMIHAPLSNIDREYMKIFHNKAHQMLYPLKRFSPALILMFRDADRRMILMQDLTKKEKNRLFPVVYKKDE